jgi:hypothetical protein
MSWASWPTHCNLEYLSRLLTGKTSARTMDPAVSPIRRKTGVSRRKTLRPSPGGLLCISKHVLIAAYWSSDVSVFIAFLFHPDIPLSLYFGEHTPYCRVTTRPNNLLLFWELHFYTSDLGTPPVTNRNIVFSSVCSTHQNGEHRHFCLRSTAAQNAMD